MADFAAWWNIPVQGLHDFDRTYLDAASQEGTAKTGCFGMRSMWDNMPGLIKRLGTLFPKAQGDLARLHAAFGPLKFIHLSRADKVAEAVSLAIAAQTGLWHRNADGSELERISPHAEPVYDLAQIAGEYDTVTAGDAAWRQWFAAQRVAPLSLSYESLAADPSRHLRDTLAFLDLDPTMAEGIKPGTAKLATTLSTEWATRFRTDMGIAPVRQPT